MDYQSHKTTLNKFFNKEQIGTTMDLLKVIYHPPMSDGGTVLSKTNLRSLLQEQKDNTQVGRNKTSYTKQKIHVT
jgi:hypothetical protein